MHDVFAYGVIASSTFLELGSDYPSEGGYAEVVGIHRSIGGEAAAGAYVLARLGVATKLDGNRLTDDESSATVIQLLSSAGVDCSAISLDGNSGPVTEVIIATGEARTIFGTYANLAQERAWNSPAEEDIRSSRIVCLDPFAPTWSQEVARLCVEADTPYVTVDAPPDSEIAAQAAVLVIAQEFADRTFGDADPRDVLAAYTDRCTGLVILTRGGTPGLFGRNSSPPRAFSPFPVEARDTTGAGDAFRAGLTYGLLRGETDDGVIRTASATAAMVCERAPGVVTSPTERELLDFMAART